MSTTPDQPDQSALGGPPVAARPSSLGELIASVPFLLGRTPRNQFVLVADLPDAADPSGQRPRTLHALHSASAVLVQLDPATLAERLQDLMPAPLSTARSALLLLVGDGRDVPSAPQHRPMRALAEEFSARGVRVEHVAFTPRIARAARWHDYRDPAGGGRLPDPHDTPLGRAMTRSGQVLTDGYRATLHRFTTAPDYERRRVAALVDRRIEVLLRQSVVDVDTVQCSCLDTVDTAVRRTIHGQPPLSDDERADVLAALTIPEVRDALMAPRPPREAPLVEQLWFTLLRVAPFVGHHDSLRLLIAYSAFLRGDSTLATVALSGVIEPSTQQALLTLALTSGLPRQALRRAITKAATATRTALAGPG